MSQLLQFRAEVIATVFGQASIALCRQFNVRANYSRSQISLQVRRDSGRLLIEGCIKALAERDVIGKTVTLAVQPPIGRVVFVQA